MIRKSLLIVIAAVLFPVTASAQSAVDEVRFGVLGQSWGGPGSDKQQTASFNLEALFHSPEFLSAIGSPRPAIGAIIAADFDATHQFYTSLEWEIPITRKFFFSPNTGITIHTGETKFDPIADAARAADTVFLGCRVLFRVGADLGYRVNDRVTVAFHVNHISNASICTPNEGLDNAGIRVGYKF